MKIRFMPVEDLKKQGYVVEDTEGGLKLSSGKPFYWGLFAPTSEPLEVGHALQYLKLAQRHHSTYLIAVPGLSTAIFNQPASPQLLVVSSAVYAKLADLEVKFEGVRRRTSR